VALVCHLQLKTFKGRAVMPRGTVTAFEVTKGFGTLRLETGEELPFDISASNKRGSEIRVGETAEVTVGVGYTGKPKAKLLVFELEADRAPTFANGFKQLQQFGFFKEWDLKQARGAAKEALDEVPSKLTRGDAGGLFQHYYGEGLSDRGRREGVIVLDWRFGQVTQTPARDLHAISGGAKVEVSDSGGAAMVDGRTVDISQGLEPLLKELNRSLEAQPSSHRYFMLDFDGDFFAVAFRSSSFNSEVGEPTLLKVA
jgi:cold shock CspA family protein